MSIGAGIFCIVAALILGALYFAQFAELNRYKAVCDEFFAPPEVYTMVVYHGRDEAFVSGLISLLLLKGTKKKDAHCRAQKEDRTE